MATTTLDKAAIVRTTLEGHAIHAYQSGGRTDYAVWCGAHKVLSEDVTLGEARLLVRRPTCPCRKVRR